MNLIRKILSERRKILKAIVGGNKASVSRDLQKYLSIDGQSPDRTLRLNTAAFDESMSSKGFFSMAVSEGISPSLGDALYRMRDTSETQFSILKTQEGGAATRPSRASVRSRCFIRQRSSTRLCATSLLI